MLKLWRTKKEGAAFVAVSIPSVIKSRVANLSAALSDRAGGPGTYSRASSSEILDSRHSSGRHSEDDKTVYSL